MQFRQKYLAYEKAGKGRKTIKAQTLWFAILDSQVETGTPYMLYKDSANLKSNQQNLGTIKSSNLCTEIMEYTAPDEVAVCNLASINLGRMVEGGVHDTEEGADTSAAPKFNFQKVSSRDAARTILPFAYPPSLNPFPLHTALRGHQGRGQEP